MEDNKKDARDLLSQRYAVELGEFQQFQQDLMEALRSNEISGAEFEKMCDEQARRLKDLKHIKYALMTQRQEIRNEIRSGDGETPR